MDKNFEDKAVESTKTSIYKLAIFASVFVVLIPYLLYKFVPWILPFYMPNVDMIANILSNSRSSDYFDQVYPEEPKSTFSKVSITLINYVSLLSLFGVIVFVLKPDTPKTSMIVFGVMAMMTYLAPTFLIPSFMKFLDERIHTGYDSTQTMILVEHVMFFMFAISFIASEAYIIENWVLG